MGVEQYRRDAPRWQSGAILLLLLLLMSVELLLADRKYGIFTGGFGQSRAVDTIAERVVFVLGYLAANGLFLFLARALIWRGSRWKHSWPPVFQLYVIYGGGFVLLLAAQYQLHSYFSDAVSFQLLANLGGGSLLDALLFAANEIVLAGSALLVAALLLWIVYRILLRRFPPRPFDNATAHSHKAKPKTLILLLILSIAAAFTVPRFFPDSAHGLNRTLIWRMMQTGLSAVTDFDRDGYGLTGELIDVHPFDAERHPLALDLPSNGIDEDGFGGDLRLIDLPRQPAMADFSGNKTNLIVVVLESARFDMIGKRVNGKAVAPNLEALVAEGSVVRPTFSHIGFTTASLKSLFAGAIEPEPNSPSLFRELKASGYGVAIFSGQPESFGDISEVVGMRESADVFVDGTSLQHLRAFSNAAQGSILIDEGHILDAFEKDYSSGDAWTRPQFIYFNFQSGHFPYDHAGVTRRITKSPIPRAEISAGNAKALRETYWNALAYADERLGQLVASLKAKGVWDNSLLLVTGDHGEELFENGFLGHGHNIGLEQYGTFLVSNRPGLPSTAVAGMSDYRAMIHALLRDEMPSGPRSPTLMLVGDLDRPTQIGMAEAGGRITTLRLDTREACFKEQNRCEGADGLTGELRNRVSALIQLWGSARWQKQQVRRAAIR